jgi:hypothetical protein
MAIKRSFILSSGIGVSVDNLFVVNNTNSVSSTTGSVVLSGGIGIGQSVSLSGRLQLFNSSNYTAFVSSASGNTVYTLPATSPATGSSVLQSTAAGVMSWVPMTASGNTAQNIAVNTAENANVFHPILFTPSSLSAGSAVSSDSTISFNPSTEILHVSGLAVTSTTSSTSSSTGALVVSGGVGVQGDLFVAANANTKLSIMQSFGDEGGEIFLNKPATNSTITNGVTIDIFQNRLRFFEQGGSARGFFLDITTGGNGVATNIMGGSSSGTVNSGTATYAAFYPASSNAVSENANLQFTGTGISIGGNIASTSTTSGSLGVYGGVGIGQSVSVGGRLQMFNGANYTAFVSSASGNTVYTLPATSPATGSSVLQSTSAGVMSWVAMSSGSSSGGVTDGSVQYKSGSGFASTNSFFYDTTIYALRLSNFPAGEATSQTSAALKVEQTTGTFNGSINGTMIAVNANNGFTGDLLNLQTNAITKFKVDAAGAIGASSDIVTVSTTASTNTTSGALQVRGGAGIAQSLFVGGTLNVGADLIISGLTTLTYTSEKLTTKTSATGTVTHDLSTGSIFYHSSISNNFTANITNVPTTNDRAIGVTLVLAQGVTPYMSTALQIDGSAQTIKWVNNITPTGTASKVDIVGFSLIRTGSAWTVLGQYSTYG